MHMKILTIQLTAFFRSTCSHVTHQKQRENKNLCHLWYRQSLLITFLAHLFPHNMGLQNILSGLENHWQCPTA